VITNPLLPRVALTLLGVSLAACSPYRVNNVVENTTTHIAAQAAPAATAPFVKAAPPTKILTAMGYGTVDMYKNYSPEQHRLMSMRASKMDALRNLAEQVYGVQIHGHTTVSDMVVKNDSHRSYLDVFLKGARVKSMTAIDNNTYESVVEITLTPKFYNCLNGTFASSQCGMGNGYYGHNQHADTAIASLGHYNCNSIDCYKYPDISGFYN